jgi:predicted  nucleic acid-binding Zn-ribbon protein
MLPFVFKWLMRQVSLADEVARLRNETEELTEDQCRMREEMLQLRCEMQAALAKESAEREKFMLQVQNLLLQWERRLPPPATPAKPARKPRRRRAG